MFTIQHASLHHILHPFLNYPPYLDGFGQANDCKSSYGSSPHFLFGIAFEFSVGVSCEIPDANHNDSRDIASFPKNSYSSEFLFSFQQPIVMEFLDCSFELSFLTPLTIVSINMDATLPIRIGIVGDKRDQWMLRESEIFVRGLTGIVFIVLSRWR